MLKIEGLEGHDQKAQFRSAIESLSEKTQKKEILDIEIRSWKQFFELAARYIGERYDVLYLEEIQWLANYKPKLISDLKHVWDNKFSKIADFKLILCGSSPSFVTKNIIRSKALYNRSQEVICLKPFDLKESKNFLHSNKSTKEILDGYLLLGGVPPYLERLNTKSSVLLSLANESF